MPSGKMGTITRKDVLELERESEISRSSNVLTGPDTIDSQFNALAAGFDAFASTGVAVSNGMSSE